MAEPEIKDLCDKHRFPQKGWKIFTLLLYSPFGLALAIIRVFIAIQALIAALVLPDMSVVRSVVLRMIFGVLGIVLKEENTSARDKSVNVITANYITQLDFIVAHLATGSITWDLPSPLAWLLRTKYMGESSRKKPDISKLRIHLDKGISPIFLQPEESATNGKVGLLKFAPWLAEVSDSIQPVVIRTSRPSFVDITCDVLGSTFLSELFWFLFTPSTFFTMTYLPVIHKEEEETNETFTERIEKVISEDLGISVTKHTAADKAEYEKRYLIEYNQPVLVTSAGQSSLPCAELQHMASQVKEVLPHVPVSAILQDLSMSFLANIVWLCSHIFAMMYNYSELESATLPKRNRTQSVDLTISNILEGNVHYTPIPQQPPPRDPVPSSTVQTKTQPVIQSLSQGQGKVISFMERKAKLIAEARRRYIEKHGLVDAWAE